MNDSRDSGLVLALLFGALLLAVLLGMGHRYYHRGPDIHIGPLVPEPYPPYRPYPHPWHPW